MPRTVNLPPADYAPNPDGTPAVHVLRVDSLTKNDTDYLLMTITPDGPWPEAAPLLTGGLIWSDGSGSGFTVNSPYRSRLGAVLPAYVHTFDVRRVGSSRGKSDISGGDLTVRVHAPCRVAFSLEPRTGTP